MSTLPNYSTCSKSSKDFVENITERDKNYENFKKASKAAKKKKGKLYLGSSILVFPGSTLLVHDASMLESKLVDKLSSRIMAALNDRAAIRENNSVIPSLVFEETDQYSAFKDSAIVMARFSTIS
ncbi:hypothetical protein KQX54_017154 [Cotesia glomerata]|uniref:Uncharacterized protein n=1 Tax=Cotesia glomerata TaxID=32391 RepID=A0AAV7IXM4_COTGL|nr:hypothetical protein KQX54_017154 [Cotesia glomerata]